MSTRSPEESPPTALQPEEIEDYHQLRDLLNPKVSLEVLDNFAKWLFTLTAAAGSLGAGLGVTGANSLSDKGRDLFAIAVVLIAVSLALAALACLPLPVRGNRYSRVSLRRGLAYVIWTRFVLVGAAALLFASGLALAGWAQVS